MSSSALRLVSVLPGLLGTYGDSGNVLVLRRRLAWRDIGVEVLTVGAGEAVPTTGDLYVLGGGEDDAQLAALEELQRSGLTAAIEAGAVVLAVCAGLQILGESLELSDGRRVSGLGLLDLVTTRLPARAVGEVVAEPEPALGLPLLTGFSNHGGSTVLGPEARPLANVQRGPGNAGENDTEEGALQGSVVGTYLHGPVLARNPALADLLLARALGTTLAPLPDGPPEALHSERIAAR